MLGISHVDEVDDHQAAEIPQPQLARRLVGGLQVGAVGHLLLARLTLGAARVHVDGGERLGGMNHQAATAGQRHLGAGDVVELPLEAEVAKQRHLAGVEPHDVLAAAGVALEEVEDRRLHFFFVGDDLFDVIGEVVAHGANHHARLAMHEPGLARRAVGRLHVAPDANQLLVVALQLFFGSALTGGAHDDAHGVGHIELLDERLELTAGALVVDLAADAAAAAEGHQHHEAPRQGEIGGERRALVADLFFVGLHHHLGAHAEHVLNAGAALALKRARVVALVDVVEGDEAVALGAVVDERGLQAGLNAHHAGFVNVAADLLVACVGDVEIFKHAVFNNRDADFTRLCRVDQHLLAHWRVPARPPCPHISGPHSWWALSDGAIWGS